MQHEVVNSQLVELTKEIGVNQCVCFDSETAALDGFYTDELSAFRARKVWIETLESNFLLEHKGDFRLKVISYREELRWVLRCEFLTACGRYAFWRLTNHQAPEAQYLIETAHIPLSESLHDEFVSAPDMRESRREYFSEIERALEAEEQKNVSFSRWVFRVLRKLQLS